MALAQYSILHVLSSIMAIGALAACSGSQGRSHQAKRYFANGRSDESLVPDLSRDFEALAEVQSFTENHSANAPRDCLHLITQDPRDFEMKVVHQSSRAAASSFLCSIEQDLLSEIFFAKASNSRNDGSSIDIGIGIPINEIPVDLKFKYSGNLGSNYTKEFSRMDAKAFREEFCSGNETSRSHESAEELVKKVASPATLHAFNECINFRQKGFLCTVSQEGDGVAAHLRWEPSAEIRRILPRVSLELVSHQNMTLESLKWPEILGIGTGVSVSFSTIDKSRASTFQVVARDASGAVALNCSRIFPPIASGQALVWGQHPLCGLPIKKSKTIFREIDVEDQSRPESVTVPGQAVAEPFKGHLPCGHTGLRTFGRGLCAKSGFEFVRESVEPKTCLLKQGVFSRWAQSYTVSAYCRESDREITSYPYKTKKMTPDGEETKYVTPACQLQSDTPGIRVVSEQQAKLINDPGNFDYF